LLIIAAMAAFPLLVRIGFRAPRIKERSNPEQLGLAYREVSIPTENGKRLFAWFVPPPATGPAPAVAVLHG
jgi:poly(3-hydroxybutyrate) depolymerase